MAVPEFSIGVTALRLIVSEAKCFESKCFKSTRCIHVVCIDQIVGMAYNESMMHLFQILSSLDRLWVLSNLYRATQ